MLDSNSWVSSVVVHRFKNMFLSSLTTIWQFFLIPTFHSIILPSLLQTHVKALEEATAAVSRTGYLLNIIRKILLPRPAPRWVHPPSYGHVACGSSLAKIGCQNRRRAEKGRRGEGRGHWTQIFFFLKDFWLLSWPIDSRDLHFKHYASTDSAAVHLCNIFWCMNWVRRSANLTRAFQHKYKVAEITRQNLNCCLRQLWQNGYCSLGWNEERLFWIWRLHDAFIFDVFFQFCRVYNKLTLSIIFKAFISDVIESYLSSSDTSDVQFKHSELFLKLIVSAFPQIGKQVTSTSFKLKPVFLMEIVGLIKADIARFRSYQREAYYIEI